MLFLILLTIATYLYYRRFPNNYLQPNFFGEEGNVFANNIIHHGFLHAFNTTFNGYYIWGIYLLEKIAFIVNWLFYGNQFVNLPRAFALVSYGFLGLVSLLPLLLLRRNFKLIALLVATMLLLYVPLSGWDYGIIGALGDMKFAYIFVAFILLIYRHYLPENSKKVYLVDLVLLICAYTNITVYIMLPFALLRYWPKLKGDWRGLWSRIRDVLWHDRTAQSLVVLAVAFLPQLYIIKRDGIPALPGYLDSAYIPKRTVEIFISRSYLYEIFFALNKHLNDTTVIVSFLAILALMWRFTKKYWAVMAFGILTIFFATFLFVIKRTGVSAFYIGYKDPGPAQFFFAQNWVFGFLFSVLAVEIISKIKGRGYRFIIYCVGILFFLIYLTPFTGSFGANGFEEKTVGNIYGNAQAACKIPSNNLSITIYPTSNLKYTGLTRQQLCTPAATNYQPQDISLGLTPAGNNYKPIGDIHFTQTFMSPANNLNGVEVYFSTFATKVSSPYTLKLYNTTCKVQLASINIHTKSLTDNDFANVLFPTIQNSKGKTYCFTIIADKPAPQPLAIQLSAPDSYPTGQTIINGQPTADDVVFALHYK